MCDESFFVAGLGEDQDFVAVGKSGDADRGLGEKSIGMTRRHQDKRCTPHALRPAVSVPGAI